MRFRRLLLVIVSGVGLLMITSGVASGAVQYQSGTTGYDVSWPNCGATPPKKAAFGIIGVTGGLDFRPNNCLAEEAGWFEHYDAYMNTGYPGFPKVTEYINHPVECQLNDQTCYAYEYGYNAAEYALVYAARANVHASTWWLDVETVNSWDDNPLLNRAALKGMVAAIYRDTFFTTRVGYYAFPGQWNFITGNWKNGLPAWAATGSLKRQDALAACTQPSFSGGPLVMTQYTVGLDRDYVCNSWTF